MTQPTTSRALAAENLSLSYDGHCVVHTLDLEVPRGQVSVIVGANACGKSTLLKGLARLLRPSGGRVTLDGRDIRRHGGKEFARMVGLLPQQPLAPDGITVADLVGRGRYPHQGVLRRDRRTDEAAVALALELTQCAGLAGRAMDELSGGQRQRAWVAVALAQDPDILLLDEPTTYLDLAHQVELLDLFHQLNRARGTTIVMVLHELNLAARYADHLVVMAGGRIAAEGPPERVLTSEVVRDAFALESRVVPDPISGTPLVVPIGRFHRPPAAPQPAAP
ncbi:ATP-binding cassette domain-containing protein [Pseudactinotalea sp. HY160]|uniref:ABC transporter ATP-binding protein n=1 Tax=Pseudactinotalea sp. HY160 TaxID=2654490 RepID=UPI00128E3144|nr:ABC transporter ATP-binding protein [Pseudactinotalea sp. HY160]MPV50728.1 ATP-binding cassette domain-containing protein [Pseudactinotalea sp. HY160]